MLVSASSMLYDAALRLQQVTHAKSSTILSRTDYLYDKNGNRTKETINRNAAAQVTNYRYDNADRLTQTELIDVNQTVTTDYTLDAVANRIKEIVTTKPAGASSPSTLTKTYTYDGRNQLTAIADSVAGNTDLSYDSQGNLLQKSKGSDITAYSYNARDNLISIRQNSTVLGNYRNDHLGLRVEKEAKDPLQPNAPPVTLRTLWNGRHAFQDSDTSGNTLSRYENDGRHTVSLWSSTDGSQALHHDALGSIVASTDTTGQLKSETIYDAFGNISSQSGQSANKFGYTGHQMDKESGLIYFQARYYDPQTGRFLTQDPYEGDWNTPLSLHHYLYAYGNPTSYIDLTGYANVLPQWRQATRAINESTAIIQEGVGAAAGGIVGAGVGTAKVVAATAVFVWDISAIFGNKDAAARMDERGKIVATILLRPDIVKQAIDEHLDEVSAIAERRRAEGNYLGAGFAPGYAGGEIVGPLAVGRLRISKGANLPKASANNGAQTPAVIVSTEAPIVPKTEKISNDVGVTVEKKASGGTKIVNVSVELKEPVRIDPSTEIVSKQRTDREVKNARQRGVNRAKAAERDLVVNGHEGTADEGGWTWKERKQIAESGQFPDDIRWHHLNDVKRSPELADVPDNVVPSRGSNAGHVEKYHPNGTRAGSSGKLIDRKFLKDKHLNGDRE